MDSLCRCWFTNSLSCLKKLFGHETKSFVTKVLFECPPAGALEKLPKRETLSFASLGCSLRQLVELPQKIEIFNLEKPNHIIITNPPEQTRKWNNKLPLLLRPRS